MAESNSPGIRFGAAYYHEYQPTPRLDEDLDLMKQAGFTAIRVGESVWSTWEPEDGVFDLDWLEPVLDGAHARGIGVILGTPTYAMPMWLARKHPEIAGETATGKPMTWGGRQEMDFTSPAFRFHAERVIRKIVGRYRDHPAIIGYQVDNEPGLQLLYNRGIFEGFVDHLRQSYGDVETLNREWGLVYWSHRLSTWADLWVPDRNFQPQYDLAWRRYQAGLVTEYIAWQAGIVRELAHPQHFVTTCISYDQPGVEDVDLGGALDVAAGNAYYEMQDSLTHPSEDPRSAGWIVKGTWALHLLADLMYSSKQAPFLVTETNAGSIGLSSLNYSPHDGQWRQAAWALVARGANMIEYWHWHTLHFGAETYWGGVLPHSQRPGRVYRELARLGAEFEAAGTAVAEGTPDSDIVILYDSDSKFALSSQPPFSAPGQYLDADSYRRILSAFYRGAFDAGLQVNVVRPQQLFASRGAMTDAAAYAAAHPVLLVPAFFTAADGDLEWLEAYADAGGHLVLGPRTGYADREGRARTEVQPALLSDAAGVWYDEFANLSEPISVASSGIELRAGAAATDWVDGLTLSGAEALVSYAHPHFGRWAAVTSAGHGAGRVTTVGTVPNQALAHSLASWLVPAPLAAWPSLPDSVTVATRTDQAGARVAIVHNWSWQPQTVTAPADLTDLIGGSEIAAEDPIALGPWDVRVLRLNSPSRPKEAA
ncbi:beta-galactosidase [Microbacterium sp. STN6]|uniref:beta-galactosidase n=1 Tax=Microbacterium sp. STN6 TaxID=2995588 RepID=UPI002260DA2A|nr:beta-galactosidase [Microbacterium sp. STN6]MCX7522696.1 beta-galactosidase [Microbacterium sp. STN6]